MRTGFSVMESRLWDCGRHGCVAVKHRAYIGQKAGLHLLTDLDFE